jgi:membrane peptidoglycan carboxypeptidase
MGYPNANKTMANVHGVPHVVGGSLPSMIWHDFMVEAVKDVEPLPFATPGQLQSVAKKTAEAIKKQHELMKQRGGFEIGDPRPAEDLAPDPQWFTPMPKPKAKAPPAPATTTSTSPSASSTTPSTAPPGSNPSPSTTTTTRPPPENSPVPDIFPVPRR